MAELERQEIEKIYDKFCGGDVRMPHNNVAGLYESLEKIFDEYENEIILDAFYQGYICGLAAK